MSEIVRPKGKTECPFCGNVWQDHTLNEIRGCMAMMQMQFSAAIARSGTEQNKTYLERRPVEPCPVCNKLPAEHTEDDLTSCVAKWRKRERGSTGLELQSSFEIAGPPRAEPDPVKREQSRTRFRQMLCSCGKARGDHTQDEIRACAERNPKPLMTHVVHRAVNARVRTPEEIAEVCQGFKASFKEQKYAEAKCPFCSKLRGEHSEAEVDTCVELLQQSEDKRRKRYE
jgi:hypothetical protein